LPRLPAEVRRATADDIDDVLLLWRQARDELDRAGRLIAPTDQVRPRLLDAMATGDVEVVIARWDGRPAGFLVMRVAPLTMLVETPSVHLEQLFVAPDLRRHGIARALLNGVVARADRVCAEQVVTSVMPWARDTHRFFARLGFSPFVVRRTVSTSVLRRRLAGESPRSALEDLLSRRRSLRARARQLPVADAGDDLAAESDERPCDGAPADVVTAGDLTAGDLTAGDLTAGDLTAGDLTAGDLMAGDLTGGDVRFDTRLDAALDPDRAAAAEGDEASPGPGELALPADRPAARVTSAGVGGSP
jgi:GNAT superfamily N-acetyltransferase